jgi:N-acetylglucosamine kinase-like BadF-type ATPase
LQKYLNNEEFPLGTEIVNMLGCKLGDLMERSQAQPGIVFPKIFPLISKAAEEGDEWACARLICAAKDLHNLAHEVIDQLQLRSTNFFLAKTGGVFEGSSFLNVEFDRLLRQTAPNARIGPLPRPVSEWAAQLARDTLTSPLELPES